METDAPNDGDVLLEFRAGRMSVSGSTVKPDPRKGLFRLIRTEDLLLHLQWLDRTTQAVEEDMVVFPDEAKFEKVSQSSGRVYMLSFNEDDRKLFFWMQEPKAHNDEHHCSEVNRILNEAWLLEEDDRVLDAAMMDSEADAFTENEEGHLGEAGMHDDGDSHQALASAVQDVSPLIHLLVQFTIFTEERVIWGGRGSSGGGEGHLGEERVIWGGGGSSGGGEGHLRGERVIRGRRGSSGGEEGHLGGERVIWGRRGSFGGGEGHLGGERVIWGMRGSFGGGEGHLGKERVIWGRRGSSGGGEGHLGEVDMHDDGDSKHLMRHLQQHSNAGQPAAVAWRAVPPDPQLAFFFMENQHDYHFFPVSSLPSLALPYRPAGSSGAVPAGPQGSSGLGDLRGSAAATGAAGAAGVDASRGAAAALGAPGVAPAAAGGGGRVAGPVQLAQLQSILAGLGQIQVPQHLRARSMKLTDILKPEVMMSTLSDGTVQQRLAQFLPPELRKPEDMRQLVLSPQFQQQLDAFSEVLLAGKIDLSQFGIDVNKSLSLGNGIPKGIRPRWKFIGGNQTQLGDTWQLMETRRHGWAREGESEGGGVTAARDGRYKFNLNEYMVTIEKPLGIWFSQTDSGAVYVEALQEKVRIGKGNNHAGDNVLAGSAGQTFA
ncbi:unnamed protein product [Closterium sp. NIES-65]|nr:unnamed protein product [Closterium sp. NIES-65]